MRESCCVIGGAREPWELYLVHGDATVKLTSSVSVAGSSRLLRHEMSLQSQYYYLKYFSFSNLSLALCSEILCFLIQSVT